jgi:hypothetical protein
MQHSILSTLIGISVAFSASAQTPLSAKISIKVQPVSKEVELKSNADILTTQLKPRSAANAAAQKPFIKHFWEFGDGNYSTDEKPQHSYTAENRQKSHLYMTPCYTLDKIKPDSQVIETSMGRLAAKSLPDMSWNGTLRLTSNLTLHNIEAVRANDVFVGMASFRNAMSEARNAKLYIFYNKIDQVKTTGKILMMKDARLHGTTAGVPNESLSTVNTLKKGFYDVKMFNINGLDKTARNLFMTFEVVGKPGFEKIKNLDIVAALVMDGSTNVEQTTLTFKIASSFDPNNIKAPGTMSFRHILNKTLKYRINFENVGNSPATSVKVKTDIPDALDAYSVKIIKMMPEPRVQSGRDTASKFTINPDGKFITFNFNDVELSGTKEPWKPKKKDAQGYVEYELKPKKSIRKRTLESGAEIVFDQNAPIITDKDKTPFRNGISLGVKAGINYQPNTSGYNYFIGATYSAFRPAGIYFQIEAMADLNKRVIASDSSTKTFINLPNAQDGQYGYLTYKDSILFQEKYNRSNSIRLVPVHFRCDVGKFLSIGLGLHADLTFSTVQLFQTATLIKYRSAIASSLLTATPETCRFGRKQTLDKTETTIDYGAFADLALGNFSHGLSLGFRAIQPFKIRHTTPLDAINLAPQPRLERVFQLYLSYKIL